MTTALVAAWHPQTADRILIAGDESALESIREITAGLHPKTRGQVFVEVASAADIQPIQGPGRVSITWLVRDRGQSLRRSVDAWLSEMLPVSVFTESTVYAWIVADGPARLLSSN